MSEPTRHERMSQCRKMLLLACARADEAKKTWGMLKTPRATEDLFAKLDAKKHLENLLMHLEHDTLSKSPHPEKANQIADQVIWSAGMVDTIVEAPQQGGTK